jgi:uncharacterized protein (DUF885 family)
VSQSVNAMIEHYVERLTASEPVLATQLGMTGGMDRLPSFSSAAVHARLRDADEAAARFRAAYEASDDAARDDGIDALIGWQMAQRVLRDYRERKVHETHPVSYLDACFGILLDMIKDIAPADERVAAVRGRLRALPGMLEEARANLTDASPRVLVEMGADYAEGVKVLVGEAVRGFAAQAGLPGALDEASRAAEEAVARYHDFLVGELMPRARSDVGAGRELIASILRDEHLLGETPENIAAVGQAMIEETRGQMEAVAAEMGYRSVQEAVQAVRADHPAASDVVPSYQRALAEARRYIVAHDLVTLPAGEELVVEATPDFLKPLLPFAAYEGPGPFEARQRGFYWVTPPRESLSGDEIEEALENHPYASMPTVAAHETYPGHHTQFVRANRAATLARRVAYVPDGGTLLIEGWAFYCEEMMEREGFLAAPAVRLMRLNDQIWRACRIVIDMGVNLGEMAFDEAVDLLAETAHMNRNEAEMEVRWYVGSPGYPMCYMIGKREVVALARDFARERTTSLKAFHDALLDWGPVAPALIRWGMGLGPKPAV